MGKQGEHPCRLVWEVITQGQVLICQIKQQVLTLHQHQRPELLPKVMLGMGLQEQHHTEPERLRVMVRTIDVEQPEEAETTKSGLGLLRADNKKSSFQM